METRKGLLTKLAIYSGVAISLFLVGKKHIAYSKERRHQMESDAGIETEVDEFGFVVARPGFPEHNKNLDYENEARPSKYEGLGNSYTTRRAGDRFSMWAVLQSKWLNNDDEK
ncbi:hypothetical protein DICA3_D04698 [Diutina catenulata]